VGQKSKTAYFCNNFVYCQTIFIIFGILLYIIGNLQLDTSVVIIANFRRMIFKRIVPDEYYLFSSDGYSTGHLCRNKSFI